METVKGYETCAQLFLCQNFVPALLFQPAIAVYLQPTARSSRFKGQHLQLNRVCGSFIKEIDPLNSVKYVTSLDLKYVLCFHTKCFSELHLLRIEFSKSLILFEYFSLAESKIVHFQSRGWWVVHNYRKYFFS